MKRILLFTSSVISRKQLRFALITLLFCFSATVAYPRLKIVSSGNVGIDASNPVSRFSIGYDLDVLSPDHYEKEFTGFIAHDVQKVFPDLVSEDADGKLAIDYLGLIPIRVEAIKEQQNEIEALKKQVNQ